MWVAILYLYYRKTYASNIIMVPDNDDICVVLCSWYYPPIGRSPAKGSALATRAWQRTGVHIQLTCINTITYMNVFLLVILIIMLIKSLN